MVQIYLKKKKRKKEKNEWKSVEIAVITSFIKDEEESFPDAEVNIDEDDDSEEDKVIAFR